MLAEFAELSEGMLEMFPEVRTPTSIPKVSEVSWHPCSCWSHLIAWAAGQEQAQVGGRRGVAGMEKDHMFCWLPVLAAYCCLGGFALGCGLQILIWSPEFFRAWLLAETPFVEMLFVVCV